MTADLSYYAIVDSGDDYSLSQHKAPHCYIPSSSAHSWIQRFGNDAVIAITAVVATVHLFEKTATALLCYCSSVLPHLLGSIAAKRKCQVLKSESLNCDI